MCVLDEMAISDLANDVERLLKTFSTSTLRSLLAQGRWESQRTNNLIEAELVLRQKQLDRE